MIKTTNIFLTALIMLFVVTMLAVPVFADEEVTLSISPASPSNAGEPIVFEANADGFTNPEYQFGYSRFGGSWALIDPGPSNTYTRIVPAGFLGGELELGVRVREAGTTEWMDMDTVEHTINPVEPSVILTVTPAGESELGDTVTLEASSEGVTNPEFRFGRKYEGGSWGKTSASATATREYTPTQSGAMEFAVQVREAGDSWLDPTFIIPFTVKDDNIPQFIWLDDYYKKHIQISDFSYPEGIYFSGEQLTSSITLKNIGDISKEIWIGSSLRDQEQVWHDIPAKVLNISPDSSLTEQLTWNIPGDIISGNYELVMALWDRSPGEPGAVRIANISLEDHIRVYRNQDNFYSFDDRIWHKTRNSRLGRSSLLRRNVIVEDNLLKIKHPQNTLEGGEIRTEELKSFGSYEIRMKLQNAPSSITGFFLYKAPCYYYEIDIELYNDTTGTIFFTTYADGSKQKEYKTTLPFDPTKNFHNYRIDYYSESLRFYVDDIPMMSWNEGYPKEPMYLMVNSWYPSWLPGTPAAEDQFLQIDWIRY